MSGNASHNNIKIIYIIINPLYLNVSLDFMMLCSLMPAPGDFSELEKLFQLDIDFHFVSHKELLQLKVFVFYLPSYITENFTIFRKN